MWSLLQSPCSLRTIGTTLAAEYDVTEDDAVRDAQAFVDDLASKRLALEVEGL